MGVYEQVVEHDAVGPATGPYYPHRRPPGLIKIYMENQKPIKKNHIKEFGGGNAPGASRGYIRDVPGTPGTFGPIDVEIHIQWGRMSAGQTGQMTGQMGHVHGTDGSQTGGCPAKILYVYWFFFFPNKRGEGGV